MIMKSEYLGDSVYVRLVDNSMLMLTTDKGGGPGNTIYLEYGVWRALLKYVQRIGWEKKGNQ